MILWSNSPTLQEVVLQGDLYILGSGKPVITFSKPWVVTKKSEWVYVGGKQEGNLYEYWCMMTFMKFQMRFQFSLKIFHFFQKDLFPLSAYVQLQAIFFLLLSNIIYIKKQQHQALPWFYSNCCFPSVDSAKKVQFLYLRHIYITKWQNGAQYHCNIYSVSTRATKDLNSCKDRQVNSHYN